MIQGGSKIAQKRTALFVIGGIGASLTVILASMGFLYWGAPSTPYGFEGRSLRGEIIPYVLAERHETNLPSRKWMSYAIQLVKRSHSSAPHAARYFAYAASVYEETLKETRSWKQASIATANILKEFFPEEKEQTEAILKSLVITDETLTEKASVIFEKYRQRSKNDHVTLERKVDMPVGSEYWYVRDSTQKDKAAMAKEWMVWATDRKAIVIPAPPEIGSFRDKLELKKVEYAVRQRRPDDEEIIFFWEGIDNFLQKPRESVTVAGIWQNILFVETRGSIDDATYARFQAALAQGIADALIIAWEAKYTFFAQRPSMRIPRLDSILSDPPHPGYVSEQAAASGAAVAILTTILPEKKDAWITHAENAMYSRLLAGIHFDIDLDVGAMMGESVGRQVTGAFFPEKHLSESVFTEYSSSQFFVSISAARSLLSSTLHDVGMYGASNIFSRPPTVFPPAFINVAEESGLSGVRGMGAAWGDYNSDGYLDLLTGTGLYRNTGRGTFVRVDAGKLMQAPGVFGDYNNDGCPDVYIVRSGGAGSLKDKGAPDVLYRNNCDGTFSDATEESQMMDLYHGESAAWADYDNDGYLDLYVANRGILLSNYFDDSLDDPSASYKSEPNILYHNNKDGTFTNVTKEAGVEGILDCEAYNSDRNGLKRKLKFAFQAIWFDYNNDGLVDLFVVSDTFTSPLYKNNGDGTFTQVTDRSGLCAHQRGSNMGVAVGDYDKDGFLDMYVTNAAHNFFWHNNGDGTFSDIADRVGVDELGYGWGTEALDYDNDGDLDIIVVNGNNRLRAKYYHVAGLKGNDLDELFENAGDGTFRPVGAEQGLEGNEVAYAVAVGDYNNDGFPDVFIPINGERHSSAPSKLYRNRPNGNNWITVQLIGVKSNRDSYGARVKVQTGDIIQMEELKSGTSYLSQSSPWLTFGLGSFEVIETIEIRWPSGITKKLHNVKTNQKIVVTEGE